MWRSLIVLAILMTAQAAHAQDWEQTMQAVTYLQQYLRIDTTNPPGDVRGAVEFLTGLLRAAKIEYQVFLADEMAGKLNVLARVKGDGSAKPLLMINHIDVVPVERDKWQEDPFSGHVKDGFVWGRGALDMKAMGIAELMALIRLKRDQVPLARDVLWLAVCDEEVGGIMGAKWMVERHWDRMDPEFVIDEGGGGSQGLFTTDGRIVFAPSVNEKQVVWLKLVVRGEGGHGSIPPPDLGPKGPRSSNGPPSAEKAGGGTMPPSGNAVEILTQALARLHTAKPTLEAAGLPAAPNTTSGQANAAQAGDHPIVSEMRKRLGTLAPNRYTNAITRNTITLTSFQAGVGDPPKVNVIPSEASATLDCRLLPGVSVPEFLVRLKEILADERVAVEVVYQPSESVATSSHDTALFRAIEEVVKGKYPEAIVTPQLLPGGTDSRFFRMKGAVAYGFEPLILTPGDLDLIHGHNERISVEQFHQMIAILYEVVKRVAQAP